MNQTALQERFDKFQEPAVSNIVRDFTAKPAGRFLLVIPTAGGKTFTAVKAINRLFETRVLEAGTHRVTWTAHRIELLGQARNTFDLYRLKYPDRPEFSAHVDFVMAAALGKHLDAKGTGAPLVVIDEAHHAAPNTVRYGPLFARKNLGILGLTATPSRHDGEPLEFERESFSIGFPDLVKLGIVLKPEVRKVQGGRYEITDLDADDDREQFNNVDRNSKIIAELLRCHDEYKKVIIYVGTTKHVENLHAQLNASALTDKYESISYITGSANSRNLDRDEFIAQEKLYKRSILVNVTVLSEGYDDPQINTVVMAAPSRSKLYYMQAMGRAIRHDPADALKKAFCVEIEDTLPNIRYKIDNRWLFSEVSDALEPEVFDTEYGNAETLRTALLNIYERYKVPAHEQVFPVFEQDERYSLLLLKRYAANNVYTHFPLLITSANRLQISATFNSLSERMVDFRRRGVVHQRAFQIVGEIAYAVLPVEDQRRWVYEAMKLAVPKELLHEPDDVAAKGWPWITFCALHYSQSDLSQEILDFVEHLVNKEAVLSLIRERNFVTGAHLLRLPLPLKSYIGEIVSSTELDSVVTIVNELVALRNAKGDFDHRSEGRSLLAQSSLPIEHAHADSRVLIARTAEKYSLALV